MSVNVTKAKKQSNVRSSGNDEKRELFLHYFLIRRSFRIHSKDEYVEVTPKSIRLRKIHLTETDRKDLKSNLLDNRKKPFERMAFYVFIF
jgi:GTP-binding protein